MKPHTPAVKDLVLLGGGHAHALTLKMWAMNPLPGVRLTLVSPKPHTPYSGMLPGLLAGQYGYDDTHIDLDRLCALTGCRFIRAAASGIDPVHKTLLFEQRPALEFDWLSVDVGGAPSLDIVGSELAVPVKPISRLYARWQALRQSLSQNPAPHIAIVGGGAAALELACAARALTAKASISLYFPESLPLKGYAQGFRRRAVRALTERNIEVRANARVSAIAEGQLSTETGGQAGFDFLLLCTEVRAPTFLAGSELGTDERGFLAVNDYLQSPRYPWLFGAGDCVSLIGQPRPKAGVYAVREAPVLYHNLRAQALGEPLRRYRAQKGFLSLISLCDGSALASRPGAFMPSLSGRWVWRWKDRIDRRFMAMFADFQPSMNHTGSQVDNRLWGDELPPPSALAMRCGGCGAKVGGDILQQALAELEVIKQPEVLVGLDDPDDAAAYSFADGSTLVQSVDQFRGLIDDPWLQGRIAALHALSDLYAMNARAHSAQALVTLPFAADRITRRDLSQLMQGALSVLNPAGCELTGGHTSEGAELMLGFAVNGVAEGRLLTKAGLQVGDYLILTKPLGTGCLFAARAQGKTRGRWINLALATMQQSNQAAAVILHRAGAHACTDVTGFGLAGHLMEMLRASFLSARLNPDRVPLLDGAEAVTEQGLVSSLFNHNLRQRAGLADPELLTQARVKLWFDPQTSGGLLAGLAPAQAQKALEELQQAGIQAAIIGKVIPQQSWLIEAGNFQPAAQV